MRAPVTTSRNRSTPSASSPCSATGYTGSKAMAAEAQSSSPADEKVSILIVDDRPDKLLAHEALLDDLGENLVRANSGAEALRCLLQQDFAVILLDVNMPVMDGFETAAMI